MGIGSEETPICFPASAAPQHVLMLPGLDGSSRLSPRSCRHSRLTVCQRRRSRCPRRDRRITPRLPNGCGRSCPVVPSSCSPSLSRARWLLNWPRAIPPGCADWCLQRPLRVGRCHCRQPAQPCCRRPGRCLPWHCWRACCWGRGTPAGTRRCCAKRWPGLRRARCGNAPQRPCGSTCVHCCRQSRCRRCACTRATTACCGRPAWPSCRPCCPMPAMCRWRGHICCCRRVPTQLQPKWPRG